MSPFVHTIGQCGVGPYSSPSQVPMGKAIRSCQVKITKVRNNTYLKIFLSTAVRNYNTKERDSDFPHDILDSACLGDSP